MSRALRNRRIDLLLIVLTGIAGLTARAMKHRHPVIGDMAGDTLWATMVFQLLSLARPRAPVGARAGGAILFSFLVEFSQIYHARWIDRIRATPPGAIVLGSSFDWRDLICYVVGVGIGVAMELWIRRT